MVSVGHFGSSLEKYQLFKLASVKDSIILGLNMSREQTSNKEINERISPPNQKRFITAYSLTSGMSMNKMLPLE